MSNNINVLLVGPGMMGKEYIKVLQALNIKTTVVGRGVESAHAFQEEYRVPVIAGGLNNALEYINENITHAIVTVNVEELCDTTLKLLQYGVPNILVEKPAGLTEEEISSINDIAKEKGANVFVAYNRRFFSSTLKAQEIIEEDGGVTSFNFEFTEWGFALEKSMKDRPSLLQKNWFLANSTHVVDLAFFLGGDPEEIACYSAGTLSWHKSASAYCGAGISEKGALFSYQANWAAPGRWGVEVLTNKHRLYFRPMEELQIQELGSILISKVEIEDELDKKYKPGLFRQVEAFIFDTPINNLVSILEHEKHMKTYEKIDYKAFKDTLN